MIGLWGLLAVPLTNEKVIDAIRLSATTDSIGDGKIFVSELEQIIRIRTGEQGEEALWTLTGGVW